MASTGTHPQHHSLRFKPKIFVKASSKQEILASNKDREQQAKQDQQKGDEVSQFYHDVTNTVSSSKKKVKKRINLTVKKVKEKPRAKTLKAATLRDLLVAAEGNDMDRVDAILEEGGVDVDGRDQFGWTPLMVAACAGRTEVVDRLLEEGASWDCKDRAGNDAADLAIKKGHKEIAEVLQRHKEGLARLGQEAAIEVESEEASRDFCESCQVEVSCPRQHNSSTVHQFVQGEGSSVPTIYGIPEANRGFQMMLGGGWDRERGLGPEGREGKKFPVRTTLKRDRLGVGNPKAAPPRVTHFAANDPESVASAKQKRMESRALRQATRDKRTRNKAKIKEATTEQRLRQELNGL